MQYRILGSLEVASSRGLVPVGGRKEKALLIRLLVDAGRIVSVHQLIDDLGGAGPIQREMPALRVRVSRLRRALAAAGEPDAIRTEGAGYVLSVAGGDCDAARFEALVHLGLSDLTAANPAAARTRLGAALDLWRGAPLADVTDFTFARLEADRLETTKLVALEGRIEADLLVGRDTELVPELEVLVIKYPFRERLWAFLMRALYRSGRQVEALRAYGRLRGLLADELGINPSAGLQALEQAILLQDVDA